MSKRSTCLGIDIGGTNTVIGFVDKAGNCIKKSSILTKSNEPVVKFFPRLFEEVDNLYKSISNEYEFIGIGIGAPNANFFKSTIEFPPNLNWDYVNVSEFVSKYSSLPLAITNDANAAAIGEYLFGNARDLKDFIVITLGTGLGSGIFVKGEIVYGSDGFAGEIGHTIVDPNGRQCGCGRKGCLETYASASGICRTVSELIALKNIKSKLNEISPNKITAKMISEAARLGDQLALEAFDYTGKILGLKLADSVAYTSPEAIILFGGLAAAEELLFEPTQKYMEEYMLRTFKNKVKLLPSGLKEGDSAILGASALIWNELSKEKMSPVNN